MSGPAGGSGGSSGGNPSTQPMLVDVDSNEPLTAPPGDGIGVFVEYQTGGHWNIWWTCDTNKTGLNCAFDNVVSVSTGTITNLSGQNPAAASGVTQLSSQRIEATTTTTTGTDGITFDTPFLPGQTPIITLEANVNGSDNGSFLFFVQKGTINGGYKGVLTDPLMLEPSRP